MLYTSIIFNYVEHFWLRLSQFKLSGAIKDDPDPKCSHVQIPLFTTGIANSTATHGITWHLHELNYLLNRFGISCKSENFSKSSTVLTDKNLEIKRYQFVVSDRSLNS